jgi:hypothetical protein
LTCSTGVLAAAAAAAASGLLQVLTMGLTEFYMKTTTLMMARGMSLNPKQSS